MSYDASEQTYSIIIDISQTESINNHLKQRLTVYVKEFVHRGSAFPLIIQKCLVLHKTLTMRIPLALFFIILTGTLSAQKPEWKLKDPTVEDFKQAEEHAKTGLGEIGRVFFKFGPKKETTVSGTYFDHMDGSSTHTWHQTVEKKGRVYVNDSIANSGITLTLCAPEFQVPTFRVTIYRLEGTKVKKVKAPETAVLVKQAGDTTHFQIQPGGFKVRDILEISYVMKVELNKNPIWYPLNDISPRSTSQLDFASPTALKFKFQFEGLYESDLVKTHYAESKSINLETWSTDNPDGSSKVRLKKLTSTYIDSHDVFTFNSPKNSPKRFIATLLEETKVKFQ